MKTLQSDILENIDALITTSAAGETQFIQLYPHTGYVLRIEANDFVKTDDGGEPVLDNDGNPVTVPYRSMGGAITPKNYDFDANDMGYRAEPYEDGMELM